MVKLIQQQYFYPQPVATIWAYLTTPELMAQWLMKNDFQPVPGHEFQFRTGPIASLDFDGIFYCKVLEVVPHKKLSYTWNCGPGQGRITLESTVEWTLEAKAHGTQLLLEHRGFDKAANLDFYHGLMHGWVEKLQNIERLVNPASQGTNA